MTRITNIITFDAWGGKELCEPWPQRKLPYHIFHISTHGSECTSHEQCRKTVQNMAEAIQYRTGMRYRYRHGLRYNFLIGGDLNVYEIRGFGVQPNLPKGHSTFNQVACLIGYMGDFTALESPRAMMEVAESFVKLGVKNGTIWKFYKNHYIFDRPHITGLDTVRRNTFNRRDVGYQI